MGHGQTCSSGDGPPPLLQVCITDGSNNEKINKKAHGVEFEPRPPLTVSVVATTVLEAVVRYVVEMLGNTSTGVLDGEAVVVET